MLLYLQSFLIVWFNVHFGYILQSISKLFNVHSFLDDFFSDSLQDMSKMLKFPVLVHHQSWP